jgi:signal transduction histidine kinase
MPPEAGLSEFLAALADRHTWRPARNRWILFGLLWGLPVPLFSIALHSWIAGLNPGDVLLLHPVHAFFLLHPPLFAVVFGALGTIRRRKDRRIRQLVAELERRVDELDEANSKLRELDQLKARFMANVTHELKTPLVSIRGYGEGLLEGRFGPLNDLQRASLETAVRNARRLQKLIEELLDFERLEAGERAMLMKDFDLVPLARTVLQDLRPEIEAKRLSIQDQLPATLSVHGDPDQIGRVLVNLLSNAVKFCDEGKAVGIHAAVSAEEEQALITVWDRGPGIPTAAQKFLFTRFWQADGSASRRQGGTGLGLAIVKGILDAHHAPIRIVSSESSGTRVQFELPLAEPAAVRGDAP